MKVVLSPILDLRDYKGMVFLEFLEFDLVLTNNHQFNNDFNGFL
jgi:hypothetical protein